MWATKAAWIALALTIVLLARGLPPETFFVGDPGVKLVAARAAINHPAKAFEIPLPDIGGERVALVEPFFEVHGDHAHALTSEVFPVLSAPLIALFGIRGAYVLPALGFLLAIWACARLAAAIRGKPASSATILSAALGTPFLFYGLEFWEHAPAAGLAALATAVLIKGTAAQGSRGYGFGRMLFAGFLYGVSILLRPEALWFFVAVVVSSRLLPSPPRRSAVGGAIAGIALALSPLAAYSMVHFGTIAPPHLETQAGLMTIDWLNTRADVVTAWFAPIALRATPLWGCALALVAVCGLLMPGTPAGRRRFLATLVILDIGLVVLTAPNDGGGQWGPRYLLFAFIPASVLFADALQVINDRRTVSVVATVLMIAMGAWIQRSGYRELRATKIIYGRVLDLVRQQVPAGGYAVTDLWWLDQVAAAATNDRTILFAGSAESRQEALTRLHAAGEAAVTAFISRDESPDVDVWNRRPCYEPAGQASIETRRLLAISLRRLPDCDLK